MQNSQFERLLKLAQRTGDRLIVTDPAGKEPVVILSLAEYEGLLDHDSFRQGGENKHQQAAASADARVSSSETFEDTETLFTAPETEFDQEVLEEQVAAAMVGEEPVMVPVQAQSIRAEETEFERSVPSVEETPAKRLITRKIAQNDGGEERFYLEPIS